MCSLEATTPQLKVVKNIVDAYHNLDFTNAAPFIAKDFRFQTFPKTADHPDEAKAGHFRYGAMLSLLTKIDHNFHEVIEAQGKVILHFSATCHNVDGTVLDYDSLSIFTLVEDGQLKIANFKDFSDPEKRSKLHGWVSQALAKGTAVA